MDVRSEPESPRREVYEDLRPLLFSIAYGIVSSVSEAEDIVQEAFLLRVMVTPKVGEWLQRLMKPSPRLVVRMMGSMGEKQAIVNYPAQIEALVAEGRDPVAAHVNLRELRAVLSPFGFRPVLRVQPEELRRLSTPTPWFGVITSPSAPSRSPRRLVT